MARPTQAAAPYPARQGALNPGALGIQRPELLCLLALPGRLQGQIRLLGSNRERPALAFLGRADAAGATGARAARLGGELDLDDLRPVLVHRRGPADARVAL